MVAHEVLASLEVRAGEHPRQIHARQCRPFVAQHSHFDPAGAQVAGGACLDHRGLRAGEAGQTLRQIAGRRGGGGRRREDEDQEARGNQLSHGRPLGRKSRSGLSGPLSRSG
ncbi:hypothetical protein EAT49_08580 [Histidinibacterium lentulum]|uniref:Uncharacterized protein n=1 Tax=Histidinibacterium lentulum TaxID=2480588 RepID=A0A3N2R4G8_9RHOB|nr:hypothetical protein EAT49_08580 [Histidinibacterium lentulum]